MKDAPKFLTRKQLKSILFTGNAINHENKDLAEFTRDFYHILAAANHNVTTFPRDEENRRLDAFSRLVVGDEVCAATAFDGKRLYVSTNRNGHTHDTINVRAQWTILKGSSIREEIRSRGVLFISYEGMSIQVPVKEEIIYRYHKNSKSLRLVSGLKKVKVEPWEHLFPNVPDFTIDMDLKERVSPYVLVEGLKPKHFNKKKTPVDPTLLHTDLPRAMENMFNTSINPFKRRVDSLVDHLGLVALVTLRENDTSFDPAFIAKARDGIQRFRDYVLMQTFTWEASKWYRNKKEQPNPRFGDIYITELRNVVAALNKDYIAFKEANTQDSSLSEFIRRWIASALDKIKKGDLEVPDFVKTKPELLERVWRYIVDLEKLEQYIEENARENGELATTLAKENPWKDKASVTIVDDLGENVHAEMRILWHIIHNNVDVDYIATSKRCCAHCALVMESFGIVNISGLHGNAYSNWVFSPEFQTPELLLKLLGPDLAKRLEEFEGIEIVYNHVKYSKKEMALMIIQSVATLDEKMDFPLLGISKSKLMKRVDELACESDDEGLEAINTLAPPIDSNRWQNTINSSSRNNSSLEKTK